MINKTVYRKVNFMNTLINYFFRDEENNKTRFEAVLTGEMTDEQDLLIRKILKGNTFIPSTVGLDEVLPCEWEGFSLTSRKPSSLTVQRFVEYVRAAYEDSVEAYTPFIVNVKEVSSRDVVIWAENRDDALDKAEHLCNTDQIYLTASDLDERTLDCKGIAPKENLSKYISFGQEKVSADTSAYADDEMIHNWLFNLLSEEIASVQVDISNERMWVLGSNSLSETEMHYGNAATKQRYLKRLYELLETV